MTKLKLENIKVMVSFQLEDWELFEKIQLAFHSHPYIELYCRDLTCHFKNDSEMSDLDKLNNRLTEPDVILILFREEYLTTSWLSVERSSLFNLKEKRDIEGKPLDIVVALSGNITPSSEPNMLYRKSLELLVSSSINFLEDEDAALNLFRDYVEAIRKERVRASTFSKVENSNIQNQNINNFNDSFISGLLIGGRNITQNNIQNINPDFIKATDDLLALIENSSLNGLQKINAKSDVQIIKDLADLERTPEVLEIANSKIEAIKEVLSMTADMTSMGLTLLPILQAMFGR
jgi:hypothetical protein